MADQAGGARIPGIGILEAVGSAGKDDVVAHEHRLNPDARCPSSLEADPKLRTGLEYVGQGGPVSPPTDRGAVEKRSGAGGGCCLLARQRPCSSGVPDALRRNVCRDSWLGQSTRRVS